MLFAAGVTAGVSISIDQCDIGSAELAGELVASPGSPSTADAAPAALDVGSDEAAPAAITDRPAPNADGFTETLDDLSSMNSFDFEVHHR